MAEKRDQRMRPEGHPEGHEVAFDEDKRANFHLDADRQRLYHEVPEGYSFDKDGILHPKRGADPGQIVTSPTEPASIMPEYSQPVPEETK